MDVVVVMRRERDARAQAILDDVRDRSGARVVNVGDDPLEALPLMRHLREGGLVALQIDRLPQGIRGRKGVLFGRERVLPEGPLRLASLTGAPIVSVFSRRLGYMKYELIVGEPIRVARRASEVELDHAAAAILGELERFVAAHPTQWFHFE
jgi:KDO2-lipid IV(A) lauroyltransferase